MTTNIHLFAELSEKDITTLANARMIFCELFQEMETNDCTEIYVEGGGAVVKFSNEEIENIENSFRSLIYY